jgi:outer membrane protein
MANLLRDRTKNGELTGIGLWLTVAAMVMLAGNVTAIAQEKNYTLQDAYESAFKTYESVKIAEEGVLQAESRLDQAWTSVYPRITGNSSYTRYNETLPEDSDTSVFQPLNEFRTSVTLKQSLYTGGRTLAALRFAKNQNEASRRDLSRVKQEIMLNVSEAFYGVLKAAKQVDISRSSLDRMERHQKVTEREASTRRTKANVSALLRADTLVSQARIALVKSEEALKIAKKKLALLTGIPEDAGIAEPQPAEFPEDDLRDLTDIALQNRDDYASTRLNSEAAKEYVTVVEGAHYPQISAEGNIRYLESSPKTILDGTTYYGGLKLEVPLFEGGLLKAESTEVRSKQRQAELSEVLLKRTIETEVHDSYLHLQTVSAVLETSKLQLGYARQNFDAVEGLFSEGLLSSLSLIDAEQALSLAERDFVNATYDREVAIVNLRKTVGLLGKKS